MKLSARNVMSGKVMALMQGPVTTEVTLEIAPGVQVVSTITTESARSLGLKLGSAAYAIVKASSVMVAVD